MTTLSNNEHDETCPIQGLMKQLSGKWKMELFLLATEKPLRFNQLLRILEGSNKQSLTTALRELEENQLLERIVVNEKPLHVEYHLTEKGHLLIPIFRELEKIMKTVD